MNQTGTYETKGWRRVFQELWASPKIPWQFVALQRKIV